MVSRWSNRVMTRSRRSRRVPRRDCRACGVLHEGTRDGRESGRDEGNPQESEADPLDHLGEDLYRAGVHGKRPKRNPATAPVRKRVGTIT